MAACSRLADAGTGGQWGLFVIPANGRLPAARASGLQSRMAARRRGMTSLTQHASYRSGLQPCAHHPHQPIAELSVALHLCGVRDDHQPVVEVDDRSLFEILVGNLRVDRLALLEFGHLARLIEPIVDGVVAVVAVVLRCPTLEEDVAVAVGIDAPAPAD